MMVLHQRLMEEPTKERIHMCTPAIRIALGLGSSDVDACQALLAFLLLARVLVLLVDDDGEINDIGHRR